MSMQPQPPADTPDTPQQTAADLANPDWIGECAWCGIEVNIFDHYNCPSNPALPTFKGYVS